MIFQPITPSGVINGSNTTFIAPTAIGEFDYILVDGLYYPGAVTFTPFTTSFTLADAPIASISIVYSATVTDAVTEVPSGLVDSINTTFTASQPLDRFDYIIVDGTPYNNVTFVQGSNEFTLADAPTNSIVIRYLPLSAPVSNTGSTLATYKQKLNEKLAQISTAFHDNVSRVSAINEAIQNLCENYDIPDLIKKGTISFISGVTDKPADYFRMTKLYTSMTPTAVDFPATVPLGAVINGTNKDFIAPAPIGEIDYILVDGNFYAGATTFTQGESSFTLADAPTNSIFIKFSSQPPVVGNIIEYTYLIEDLFDNEAPQNADYFWTEDYDPSTNTRRLFIVPNQTINLNIRYVRKPTVLVGDNDQSGLTANFDDVIAYWSTSILLRNERTLNMSQEMERKAKELCVQAIQSKRKQGGTKMGERLRSRFEKYPMLNNSNSTIGGN